jgi:hypothetical protein
MMSKYSMVIQWSEEDRPLKVSSIRDRNELQRHSYR